MMTSPLVRVALQQRALSRSSGFTCGKGGEKDTQLV